VPKPLHHISEQTLELARRYIGLKTGIHMKVKSDCRKISKFIQEATGHRLSESTLYRIFIQNTTDSKPYLHTLDIIAKFCGFENWQDIEKRVTNRLRAVIIDDEKPARENLSAILTNFFPEVSVLGMAGSVTKGSELIKETNPHLVFLDIELGRHTGFDLLKKVGHRPFETIFVTAYRDYAADAFRTNAADYLLKPIDIDQLGEALHRVRTRLTYRL
jgi:CheY-like chemotaxis protein